MRVLAASMPGGSDRLRRATQPPLLPKEGLFLMFFYPSCRTPGAAGVGMRARAGYIYIRGEFVNERKAVMRAIGEARPGC